MPNINKLLILEVTWANLPYGREIHLFRNPFKGRKWNFILRNIGLLSGILFLNEMTNKNLEVETKAKTLSGYQKYQIVRRNRNA